MRRPDSSRAFLAAQRARSVLSAEQRALWCVPLEDLIRALGLEVRIYDFGPVGIDGAAVTAGGRPVIVVNEWLERPRRRFTLAHELGHYLLHRGRAVYYTCNSRTAGWMEREANEYAAQVLMPAQLLARAWPEIRSVRWMAKAFGVSSQAMEIRLGEIGFEGPGYRMTVREDSLDAAGQ